LSGCPFEKAVKCAFGHVQFLTKTIEINFFTEMTLQIGCGFYHSFGSFVMDAQVTVVGTGKQMNEMAKVAIHQHLPAGRTFTFGFVHFLNECKAVPVGSPLQVQARSYDGTSAAQGSLVEKLPESSQLSCLPLIDLKFFIVKNNICELKIVDSGVVVFVVVIDDKNISNSNIAG